MTRTAMVVIHTPTFGGPHNQVASLAEALEQSGWRYLAVLPRERGDGAERLREVGVEVCEIELGRGRRPIASKRNIRWATSGVRADIGRIRQLAVEHQVSLVQVCGLLYPQAAIAARLEQLPVVWQLLSSSFAPMPIRAAIGPVTIRLADVVMTAGEATARAHPGVHLAREDVIAFTPPVDLVRFRPDPERRQDERQRLGIGDDEIAIGTVGNAIPAKRLELLVEAAGQLAARRQGPLHLVIACRIPLGQRDYWDREIAPAVARARARGVRLTLVDHAPAGRIPDLLRALDIFCLTSSTEGVPTTVLEALASGVPVVATRAGGVGEVLDFSYGVTLPVNSGPDAIAAALGGVAGSHELLRSMGGSAREASERFSVERCAEVHRRAFDQAVEACESRVSSPRIQA